VLSSLQAGELVSEGRVQPSEDARNLTSLRARRRSHCRSCRIRRRKFSFRSPIFFCGGVSCRSILNLPATKFPSLQSCLVEGDLKQRLRRAAEARRKALGLRPVFLQAGILAGWYLCRYSPNPRVLNHRDSRRRSRPYRPVSGGLRRRHCHTTANR